MRRTQLPISCLLLAGCVAAPSVCDWVARPAAITQGPSTTGTRAASRWGAPLGHFQERPHQRGTRSPRAARRRLNPREGRRWRKPHGPAQERRCRRVPSPPRRARRGPGLVADGRRRPEAVRAAGAHFARRSVLESSLPPAAGRLRAVGAVPPSLLILPLAGRALSDPRVCVSCPWAGGLGRSRPNDLDSVGNHGCPRRGCPP